MSIVNPAAPLSIGWAETDITPQELPVYISGQFAVRVSEGIADPISATALVLDSGDAQAVFVSIDTVGISDDLQREILERLDEPGLSPQSVILHATHTHEAPHNNLAFWNMNVAKEGFDPGHKPVETYLAFAAGRIAAAISKAWRDRAPGGIAFGQDYAVLGRNRRWVDRDGKATMYNLNESTLDRFDHIEGYEDHSVNLLATYDEGGELTGILLNLACPSQESESIFEVSADFWHEARIELRQRLGEKIFILPQVSAAGELTSHLIFDTKPHERMLQLRGRTARQEIALRIADAVDRVLPYLPPTIDSAPVLRHEFHTLQLPLNKLTDAEVAEAQAGADACLATYQTERQKIFDDPAMKNKPRWYELATDAYNRHQWFREVVERSERRKTDPNHPAEVHILRLGDIAFATSPFEYYLDFGIQIKVKSKAMQTFIVELAGPNPSYIPSLRAAQGGGYGAVPGSNPTGHEAGQQIADFTVEKIADFWSEVPPYK